MGRADTILARTLLPYRSRGRLLFEYSIPRLGKRVDVVLLIDGIVFVLEFKVGERAFTAAALDQVWDYALDLKNFHETSRLRRIIPTLIATKAPATGEYFETSFSPDGVSAPAKVSPSDLPRFLEHVLALRSEPALAAEPWELGRYNPTPTIVEAAMALYASHQVQEISRSDAGATNLRLTSQALTDVIAEARTKQHKVICFVTGVPGAGKTLVGLDIATRFSDEGQLHSVFLSGNGPLVAVLREALARDKIAQERLAGKRLTKKTALAPIQAFIQNVHHFRDAYLADKRPPSDHIAVFDEAQRAWNVEQTARFMQRKRGLPNFCQSEPEFLISCLDRHRDWAVIICLVGGGQEINTGEGGVSEWVAAVRRSFPHWNVHISPELSDQEYGSGEALTTLNAHRTVVPDPRLHLAVSMRSFRAESLSAFVKWTLDLDERRAREALLALGDRYPLVLTRSLPAAKRWLRAKARGSERFGLMVSSQAQRLKPHAIDVRSPMDPIHWFLDDKEDVRSSFYLEDVATEFHVQGLEVDWGAIVWDADLRLGPNGWEHFSFVGTKWNRVRSDSRQTFLKNAYRVLLTRSRQGMVIVVPNGDDSDRTRSPSMYDRTYEYLRRLGVVELDLESHRA